MCSNCVPEINQDAVEGFGEKLLGVLNSAGLSMMISIGHRTGLFDALQDCGPVSSQELAERAKMNERYVREWLGAMVTGRIVNYDPTEQTFVLPPEHAALLTTSAAPDNFAATMQWVSVLGSVEDGIVECFRNGGGVHYDAFARFHDVMAEESAQTVVAALHDHILPIVPDLEDQLTAGIDVLDVGCGSGRALIQLAKSFPQSRFTGFDFSEEAIGKACVEAQKSNLDNIAFKVQDVSDIGQSNAFDLITAFDAIHDQRDPAKVLSEIQAALRSDGTFLMQDIASSSHLEKNLERPLSPFLYTISTMHCMTVSLAQGGAGLGTCWGEELAQRMLKDAGFKSVDMVQLPHDAMNSYFISRKVE